MTEPCLFCRIARRDATAHVVHDDDCLLAFLCICPIRPGHTLIIPKEHFPYFDNAPVEIVASIAALGQRLATAMKRLYRVERVAFFFTGGDIPHTHAHLVPMLAKTDVTSRRYIVEETLTFRDVARAPDQELARVAQDLIAATRLA